MTKDELLRHLNELAAELSVQPISDRVLRDWVQEGFLKGPTPIGRMRGQNPDWRYGSESVKRTRALLESRAMGAKRATELRLYLWARGFELPWIRVKSALISEFGRLMRRRRREGLLQYDHRQRPSLSGNELSRHLKKLGELAPRLEALSFDLSPKSILDMTSRSTWGLGDQEQVPEIVHRYMPPGLLGSADEMEGSAEEQLNEANEADLENGRQLHFDLMSRLVVVPLGYALLGVPVNDPHILAFDAAAYSLMKPEWLIRNLASFTVSAYRSRTGFDEG